MCVIVSSVKFPERIAHLCRPHASSIIRIKAGEKLFECVSRQEVIPAHVPLEVNNHPATPRGFAEDNQVCHRLRE